MSTLEIVLLSGVLVTVTTVFIVAGVLSGNRSHEQRISEVCHKYALTRLSNYSGPLQYYRVPAGVTVFKNASNQFVYMDIYEDEKPSEGFWLCSSACEAAVKHYHKSAIL